MTTDDSRRAIGKVVSVAADRLVVELRQGTDNFTVIGFDDVHYIARLGSFVMVPTQSEYVVCEIVGLRERDAGSPRSQSAHTGELDKAASAKYLDVVPVGMLPQQRDGGFRFGVSNYPSLYADVLYVVDGELDRIFDVAQASEIVPAPAGNGTATRLNALSIGTSVVFQDYDVKIRVDEFFGGHAAVLGNTGSGKSCTVASIVQSIFDKKDEYAACGATFVFFDVNGEYRDAFAKVPAGINRLYLKIGPGDAKPESTSPHESTDVFRIPHWFMVVEEWELLLRASERTQQPVLRTALGLATLFAGTEDAELNKFRNHILACCIQTILQGDASSPSKHDKIIALLTSFQTQELNIQQLRRSVAYDFGKMQNVENLISQLDAFILDDVTLPNYCHQEFEFEHLGSALDLALLYEEAHGNKQIRDYCAQLLTRFKWIKDREDFGFLRTSPAKLNTVERKIDAFVERFLGCNEQEGSFEKCVQIVILDMNEAGDEVVEIAAAVMARLMFDRLRRAPVRNQRPVNLVLEEAHRYVAEHPSKYAIDASKIFERIAKEGRKYGLFLMVASQRPSELSKTVLSQCSNFVVHRIQNPDDLQHIRQMTPFISDSVLKRLPSLPKQHALIFGNAVNIPTTFKVRDVSPKPRSDDAPIRDLWFVAANAQRTAHDEEASS